MKASKKTRKNRQALRQLLLQPLESRVVLAASMGWDGPGQGAVELTYYIANHPSSLSQAQTDQAIEAALNAWSSVANVKFTQTDTPGLKDSLDFSFSSIDGVSKTLAQSYYPDDVNSSRVAGDVQFDSAENWEVGNAQGSQAFDLTYVAAHEIGHALGLDHSTSSGSVMADSASPNTVFTGLSAADKAAILKLYAAVDSTSSNSGSDTSTGTDTSSSGTNTTTDTSNTGTDTVPFPKERWRHGGSFQQFGSRFDASAWFNHNVYLPGDVNGDSSVSPVDAISIINVLNNRININSLDLNNLGLVDTNADGSVTASDAIIVINSLNGDRGHRVTIVVVMSNTAGEDTGTTDSGTTDSGSSDSGSTDSGATDTTDSTTTDTSTTDGSSNDTTDSSGSADSGSTDSSGTDDSTDTTNTSVECFHGGSTSGTTTGSTTNSTSTGNTIGTKNVNRMLAWLDADSVVTKFDADSSGTLTESEVPQRVWSLLVNASVDTDSDSAISLAELQTAITTARQDMFNSKDADSDGQLTSSEVGTRRWNSLSKADADSSGGVSFAEFDAYVSENAGTGIVGHHGGHRGHHRGGMKSPELWMVAADSLFADFDADSDGVLTESELPSKILDDLLGKSVDANSDGSIAKDELTSAIAAARETYFTSKDADANGRLSSAEVGSRTWQLISSADTNSDDAVSLEELQAWTSAKPGNCPTATTSLGSSNSISGRLAGIESAAANLIGRFMGRFGGRR